MQLSSKLKTKYWSSRNLNRKILTLSAPLIIIIFLSNITFAQTTEQTFELETQSNGSKTYQLTISTTQTLYEYYQRQNHQIYENIDLAKFVTPSPLEPVAEDLWTIYDNSEDFANGVLMITHQIPYEGSAPQKYPIETLKENIGDCDLFSFLAASIMKAGGLDVTLLLFEEEEHMTVGVNLSEPPTSARTSVSYFTYEQKPYYIAETTGNFEYGWRVGECPDLVKGASAQVIPLNQIEQNPSPDQVFSSYSTPQHSSLLISASTNFAIAQKEIQIIGSLSPSLEGENITLYFSSYGSILNQIATIETDTMGRFSYIWDSPPGGIYSIRANWSGDSNYIGSDSSISRIVIIPVEWVMMGGIVAFSLILLVIVVLATKGSSTPSMESFPDLKTDEYDY
ncbi:MAG: Ig-like domain-containing protein [Candidatus Bathyarchaeota archaeon]